MIRANKRTTRDAIKDVFKIATRNNAYGPNEGEWKQKALRIAAENGLPQTAEALLDKGVVPDAQIGTDGLTSGLVLATLGGHIETAVVFLIKGADPKQLERLDVKHKKTIDAVRKAYDKELAEKVPTDAILAEYIKRLG